MPVGDLNINGSGASAADPVISGLPLTIVMGAKSVDIAGGVAAYIDPVQGFPANPANVVTASLSPVATQYTPAGLTGSYNSAAKTLTVANATGAAVGMYMYVSSGAIRTYGRITAIAGNVITFERDLIGANATNVGYQIAYSYKNFAGNAQLKSSANGLENFIKFQAADSQGNLANNTPGLSLWIRDIPTNVVQLELGSYANQRISTRNPDFRVLPDWVNRGGIASYQLINASGLSWWDDSVVEKTKENIFVRASNDILKVQGLDGAKSATLRVRSAVGSTRFFDMVVMSFTYDSTPPLLDIQVISE